MKQVRTRDFIYTTDGLFFASTNYVHPDDRFISFLRYIPDSNGDREKDGKKYRKVTSDEAYSYLRENHPDYLYFCEERLAELRDAFNKGEKLKNPEIMAKLMDVSDFFHYVAGVPYENLGISGSILPGLHKEDVSDIDFVIFGLENHRKAMKAFRENKGKNVHIDEVDKDITVNGIVDEFWEKVYNKRMKDSSLTMDEFKWYENRKGNRGTINGTLFDILCTKNYDEISGKWGDTVYEPLGIAQIAFDNPSLYTIENLKILDGVEAPISEVVSFTHTYAGEVIDGEHVLAKGKVEKVISEGKKDSYRLVVGTTRESMDEYVKLKESPA